MSIYCIKIVYWRQRIKLRIRRVFICVRNCFHIHTHTRELYWIYMRALHILYIYVYGIYIATKVAFIVSWARAAAAHKLICQLKFTSFKIKY